MSALIHYSPDHEPGTSGTTEDGRAVEYVEPERYFPALLGEVMNASVVFLHTQSPGVVPKGKRTVVDDAIAERYWETYGGCLIPRHVLATMERIAQGPSGEILLEDLEDARKSIFAAPAVEDAVEVHATFRIQMLTKGAEGMLTDAQASMGELMSDYLLVQRGVAEDIRRAESERLEEETRATVLARLDRAADLHFERLLGQVLHPKAVYQMLPRDRRNLLETFAKRRKPLHSAGVLEDRAAES